MRTAEEQPLGSFKKFVLLLGAHDGIEPPDAYDPLDRVTTAIICVAVRSEHAAEIRLEPMLLSGFKLVASLVHAVRLNSTRDLDLNAHVHP